MELLFKPQILFTVILVVMNFFPFDAKKINIKKTANEIEETLIIDVLQKWYPQVIDKEYGGFTANLDHQMKHLKLQNKMIVTQARHTWTSSKAAKLFPNDPRYKMAANSGFEFLKNYMWDEEFGGFYEYRSQDGNTIKNSNVADIKSAYGNSFAIYALVAYYELTGNDQALKLAQKTFYWLEKHCYDKQYGGYFKDLQRDGTVILKSNQLQSNSDTNTFGLKGQNSSIHLLESFTALYKVWPDQLLEKRLYELLQIIRDKITSDIGYMRMFFYPDWSPFSFDDSVKTEHSDGYYRDHVSFGHDIEAAFLMLEASHTLGLKDDFQTLIVARKMVDHALKTGWDEKKGGFYYQGYYFKNDTKCTIINPAKEWWVQAEGMNTLLIFSRLFPENQAYTLAFKKQWNYIKKNLVDKQYGGWYSQGIDTTPKSQLRDKGHAWKANYHESRALMHCLQMLRPDKKAPTPPQNVTRTFDTISWESGADNFRFSGYNVYVNEKFIGFTPLNSFHLSQNRTGEITVRSKDLYGNLSEPVRVN